MQIKLSNSSYFRWRDKLIPTIQVAVNIENSAPKKANIFLIFRHLRRISFAYLPLAVCIPLLIFDSYIHTKFQTSSSILEIANLLNLFKKFK